MKKTNARGYRWPASTMMLALLMNSCVAPAAEDGELEADELSWSDEPDERETPTLSADLRMPAEPPEREGGRLHLQPCYEVGEPCGRGELVCTDTDWGLYCMHPSEERF